MIFFDILINKKDIEKSARYLENYLLITLSEMYKHDWRSKEKYFKQKIKNPEGINWKRIMDINFKKFNNILKKFFGIIEGDDFGIVGNNDALAKKFFSQEGNFLLIFII